MITKLKKPTKYEVIKFISFCFSFTGVAITFGTVCALTDTESISMKQGAINLIVSLLMFQIANLIITYAKNPRKNCYTQEEVDKLLLELREDVVRELGKVR